MNLRDVAANIAYEKTKKLCYELTSRIKTSVANSEDVRATCEIPRGDELWQFFDGLKHCHTATLRFEWNNLEQGRTGIARTGEKACACVCSQAMKYWQSKLHVAYLTTQGPLSNNISCMSPTALMNHIELYVDSKCLFHFGFKHFSLEMYKDYNGVGKKHYATVNQRTCKEEYEESLCIHGRNHV
jgi:hypothetical protein